MLEIVDGCDEIACKFLEGKVAGRLGFALGAVLEIAVVCDGTEIFILCSCMLASFLAILALRDPGRESSPLNPLP
jgi:hypothetical protein